MQNTRVCKEPSSVALYETSCVGSHVKTGSERGGLRPEATEILSY